MRRWFCQFRDTAGIIILIILIINTIIIINDKNNISNYGGSDLQFIIIIYARLTITIIIVIPGRLLRLHVCSLFLWLSLCFFFSFSLSFPLVFFVGFLWELNTSLSILYNAPIILNNLAILIFIIFTFSKILISRSLSLFLVFIIQIYYKKIEALKFNKASLITNQKNIDFYINNSILKNNIQNSNKN